MREETPYVVWCSGLMEEYPSCGKQFLTEEEYNRQMDRPNARWTCPMCGAEATWDDDHYEKSMEMSAQKEKANG